MDSHTPVSFGMPFDNKIIGQEFTFPTGHGPVGQVKFLDTDKGVQLGYKLSMPIDPAPTAKMPEAYRRIKKLANGWTEGPSEQLELTGRFRFSLSDSDGFLLTRVYGPTEHLYAALTGALWPRLIRWLPRSAAISSRGSKSIPVVGMRNGCASVIDARDGTAVNPILEARLEFPLNAVFYRWLPRTVGDPS